MSRSLPVACLLLATVAACDTPLSVREPPLETSRAASAQSPALIARPIAGRCSLEFTPPMPIGDGLLRQVDEGTCELSVLGRARFIGELVLDPAARTQTGSRTLIAANGDRLELTVAGTSRFVPPGTVQFEAHFSVVGGTGRFARATGTLSGRGAADLATRTTEVELDGVVTFAAADRR